METVEQPTQTSEAEDFAEHKALRNPKPSTDSKGPLPNGTGSDSEKATTKEPDTKVALVSGENGAGDEVRAKPDRPRRNRDAEAAIANAHARAAAAETERDNLKRELEEARKPKTEATPKPSTSEPPKTDEDPKPKLAEFVAKLKPEEKYEDAVERHTEAVIDWRERQREKAQATERQTTEQKDFNARMETKANEARARHADMDEAFKAIRKDGPNPLTPTMLQFLVEHPEGFDVAYKLATNLADHARISKLSPVLQVAELMALTSAGSPAPKKVPVSKAPDPIKPLAPSGVAADGKEKPLAELDSYSAHKRARSRAN